MADDQIPPPDSPPPPLNELVTELVEQAYDVQKLGRLEKAFANAVQAALTTVLGVVLSLAAKIGAFLGKSIADAENTAQPDFDRLAQVAIQDMFGVNVASLSSTRGKGGNTAAADAIGAALMTAFSGQARGATGAAGEIQPDDAPAKAFLSAMSQLALEGWLEGWLVEALSFGQMETFGELDDTISHVLGLGRASAAVHGPLVRTMIVTPLEWKTNKERRPTLLGASTAIRQFLRGKWDWPDVEEELARAGYTEERIDALLNEARRFISIEDVGLLAHRIDRATFDPNQYLGEAGYGADDARLALLSQTTRQLDSQEKQYAEAIVAAYVGHDLDQPAFERLIDEIRLPADDAAHYKKLGNLRAPFATKHLSDSDARDAVKRELTTFAWYRSYLASEGFEPDAISVKELLLRSEINASAKAAQLKAEQEASRAADKAAADAARAERVAAKAAADALPAYAEIRRAFVRGLVDAGRVQAAIAAAHPGIAGPDAAALLADAQADRVAYLEQVEAHTAALARDADKALPLATLEESVLRGITSLDAYDRELARRGFADSNRAILVQLIRGKLLDRQQAEAARQAAEARAKLKGVSLADYERAVRLGLRTPADLEAFLRALDTPELEIRLILDLLADDQRRDSEASAKRRTADAAAASKAINLPLRRRAVIKGVRTREQYAQDLADAGVSVDDRTIELHLIDLELADAEAARAKAAAIEADRAAKEQAAPPPTLTLAQTEHAVRLGLLTPDDLRAYLADKGYTSADVETLVAIVVADIPDVTAGQKVQTAAAADLKARGIDLAALERAVARGLRSLDEYAGELVARGYGADDVALMRELLAEKVAIDLDSLRAKVTAKLAGVADAPTLEELEAAIVDGSASDAVAQAYLVQQGLARDVALVYVRLVHAFAAPAA